MFLLLIGMIFKKKEKKIYFLKLKSKNFMFILFGVFEVVGGENIFFFFYMFLILRTFSAGIGRFEVVGFVGFVVFVF